MSAALTSWWNDLPPVLRSRTWPATFASLTILALLLAFHQVVAGAVEQGEALRIGAAARADAMAHCNALSSPRLRSVCLQELDEAPVQAFETAPPPNTAALSIASTGG